MDDQSVYKVLMPAEWKTLDESGSFDGAAIDLKDGFIHLSTAHQLSETIAKHFAGAGDLVVAVFDSEALGDELRWEVSRGGDLFPHLSRSLNRAEVTSFFEVQESESGHALPDQFTS